MSALLAVSGLVCGFVGLSGLLFGLLVVVCGSPAPRRFGLVVALWWIPAVAAAWGILARDPATAVTGLCLFAVGGFAILLGGDLGGPPPQKGRPATASRRGRKKPGVSI